MEKLHSMQKRFNLFLKFAKVFCTKFGKLTCQRFRFLIFCERLARAGVSGFNKPKRTPNHPTKSHVVVAKEGSQVKTIRFGEQGAKTAGAPKAGESERMKMKRKSFKARHSKNIAKGKMSAAYWADKVKW